MEANLLPRRIAVASDLKREICRIGENVEGPVSLTLYIVEGIERSLVELLCSKSQSLENRPPLLGGLIQLYNKTYIRSCYF